MSADNVDDLHAAEDMAGVLAAALGSVFNGDFKDGYVALAQWDQYCRPSCNYRHDGVCSEGEETCGCPCQHGASEPDDDDDYDEHVDDSPPWRVCQDLALVAGKPSCCTSCHDDRDWYDHDSLIEYDEHHVAVCCSVSIWIDANNILEEELS